MQRYKKNPQIVVKLNVDFKNYVFKNSMQSLPHQVLYKYSTQ